VDIQARDNAGTTALHFSCVNMLIQNVQALLKLEADPNA
jgi:ankyrin repeat protein